MRTLSFSFRTGAVLCLVSLILVGCAGQERDPVGVAQDERVAERAVADILRTYENRDLIGVMDRVATGYLGNRSSLERNLDDQLRSVDAIDYEWFISRVRSGEDDRVIDVEFRWDRRWRDVNTDNETRSSGTTTFRLIRDGQRWLIKDIRGNNPLL